MRPPRGLTDSEATAWARLASSVVPLDPARQPKHGQAANGATFEPVGHAQKPAPPALAAPTRQTLPSRTAPSPAPPARSHKDGLDSHWERRLRAGTLAPDFTLDLHEHSLDAAYQRLLGGLDIARETGARVVLVIAGRERSAHAADRADSRGAIRAKLLDWLAASRHAPTIAAIRKAHRRHGGDGALYVVLKRER